MSDGDSAQEPVMIHPVVLSGGSGTRLWPLSRRLRPKQFVPVIGKSSLFAQTLAFPPAARGRKRAPSGHCGGRAGGQRRLGHAHS